MTGLYVPVAAALTAAALLRFVQILYCAECSIRLKHKRLGSSFSRAQALLFWQVRHTLGQVKVQGWQLDCRFARRAAGRLSAVVELEHGQTRCFGVIFPQALPSSLVDNAGLPVTL